MIPEKLIKLPEQVNEFLQSNTIQEYFEFVLELQESVKSKSIKSANKIDKFNIYYQYFERIRDVLQETPCNEGKQRFGNTAFRDFHKKIVVVNKEFAKQLLKYIKKDEKYYIELSTYLNESFGDNMRIDYGTGHELNFMVFLFCINKIQKFEKENHQSLVQTVFYDYIFTMRKIQIQYNLEPAGSHGVWGLDDYHFLPFIFGGSELIQNDLIRKPKDIHNDEYLSLYSDEYMYLNCIKFIKQVKKNVPFSQSSPYLNDISAAKSWEKVAQGMVKMYRVEVFSKYPVMKHLRFGELFPFK